MRFSSIRSTKYENASDTVVLFVELTRCENASCNSTRCVSSDTNVHDGDMPASIGNWRRISSQKPWIVLIFNNSGSSIYLKNTMRAWAMSSDVAGLRSDTLSNNSINSSSDAMAQFCNSRKIRLRISPAAALVYVRHNMPQSSMWSVRNKIRNSR